MKKSKSYHELFARFFEAPTREGLRELLKNNTGEMRNCDFKVEWPEKSDLGRHILGIGNSGGGCLIIGVNEEENHTLIPSGLSALTDKADITNWIKNYVPHDLLRTVDIIDFAYEDSEYKKLVGKKFQVLFVGYTPAHVPFVALKSGTNIRTHAIYVRREGITGEATHDELQEILNTRIETGYSTRPEMDLRTHLDQLHALFGIIPQYQDSSLLSQNFLRGGFFSNLQMREQNPEYPREGFYAFVRRMIELKKRRIAEDLDVWRLQQENR